MSRILSTEKFVHVSTVIYQFTGFFYRSYMTINPKICRSKSGANKISDRSEEYVRYLGTEKVFRQPTDGLIHKEWPLRGLS